MFLDEEGTEVEYIRDMYFEFLYNNGVLDKNKLRESWFKKNKTELYQQILSYVNKDIEKFSQLLYHFKNNLIEVPKCKECQNNTARFIGFNEGYNEFCSKKCASKNSREKSNETRKRNTLIKWGVEHTSKLDSVKLKQKNTNIQKWGHISPTMNSDVKLKQENTMLQRYGVKFSGQSKELLRKSLGTRFERYCDDVKLKFGDLEIISIEKEGELEIRCSVCKGDYKIRTQLLSLRHRRYKINPCLNCNPISSYKYTGQNEIAEYIKSLGFELELGNRKILGGKEIDIFLPGINIGIEFNGLYWHSDLFKSKNYHQEKKELSEQKKINLIHIWEDDWHHKGDIIISRINNLLNKNVEKIAARKCKVREIDSKVSSLFLEKNHLQGSIKSSHNYGLFLGDRLVSVMCFGKLRRSLGQKNQVGRFELYRFCSLLNTNVIGAFSKLLKHFELNVDPKEIITYANRDWTIIGDNVYEKNGFRFEKKTDIGYYYFSGTDLVRRHRFQFRKDKLVKEGYQPDLTEWEIMTNRGFIRIHDSGHLKYSKRINP